jgi:hypothetical protein
MKPFSPTTKNVDASMGYRSVMRHVKVCCISKPSVGVKNFRRGGLAELPSRFDNYLLMRPLRAPLVILFDLSYAACLELYPVAMFLREAVISGKKGKHDRESVCHTEQRG